MSGLPAHSPCFLLSEAPSLLKPLGTVFGEGNGYTFPLVSVLRNLSQPVLVGRLHLGEQLWLMIGF